MKSVYVKQKVEQLERCSLIRPAQVLIDGVLQENLHYFKIEKDGRDPATVTITFTPEELTVEGDFLEIEALK